jgi:hypothetical protein
VPEPSQERYRRLIFHVMDELAIYDDDEIRVERNAVGLFTAIHQKLQPEEPDA